MCKVVLAEKRLYATASVGVVLSSNKLPSTISAHLKAPGFHSSLGAIDEGVGDGADALPNIAQQQMLDRPWLLVTSILLLFKMWPEGYTANTPKEVLMLHEVREQCCVCVYFYCSLI